MLERLSFSKPKGWAVPSRNRPDNYSAVKDLDQSQSGIHKPQRHRASEFFLELVSKDPRIVIARSPPEADDEAIPWSEIASLRSQRLHKHTLLEYLRASVSLWLTFCGFHPDSGLGMRVYRADILIGTEGN